MLQEKHSHSSGCLFVLFYSCLFFINSTLEIWRMPFSPFPYLFFSSQSAESHRASNPVDESEVEMLFLYLQPKKEVCVFIVFFFKP